MDNAERNYQRYKSLFEKDAVTQQQYDNVQTEYEAAKARYEMLQRQRESLRSVGKELNTRLDQNEAAIRLAEADVALANSEYIGYSTPNKKAFDILPDEIKNDGISYLDDEYLNTKTTVFKNLSDDANKLMQDLWIDIKTAD